MKRMLALWSRDYAEVEAAVGRVNTARRIRGLFEAEFSLQEVIVQNIRFNVFSAGGLRNLGSAACAFIRGLLRREYAAFQEAIFHQYGGGERIVDGVTEEPDVIYLDSVRLGFLCGSLRKRFPASLIVVDFDDLLSLRFAQWRQHKVQASFGFVEKSLPAIVKTILTSKSVSQLLFQYEALALTVAETRCLLCADKVVLVSRSEARILQDRIPEFAQKICCVRPPIVPTRKIEAALPTKYVFVGSDTLVQNRLSIEALLNLWRTFRISRPLLIVGRINHAYDVPDSVTFVGFVKDVATVYSDPGVVLVCATVIHGGLKTKVLEAFAYGALAVGNARTFDGIEAGPGDYPLSFRTVAELGHFIQDPDITKLVSAASYIQDNILPTFTERRFREGWLTVCSSQRSRSRSHH